VELKLERGSIVGCNHKNFVMSLGFLAQLAFFAPAQAERVPAADPARAQEAPAVIRVSTPEQHPLTLISASPVVLEGKILGAVIVYDDPSTKLYDSAGDLLAVSWYDQFGIQRVAVDRALLGKEDGLDGVFVSLLAGDSI
jgi:hypothetical protein